ncbi:MAG: hypothetical protein A4E43_00336 [Methanosaeta sp. PtaB.Bin005]|nr:MAG: hypothetical protein A4E43_00336 [Methanosaeta sp. PtaB.Bin005]
MINYHSSINDAFIQASSKKGGDNPSILSLDLCSGGEKLAAHSQIHIPFAGQMLLFDPDDIFCSEREDVSLSGYGTGGAYQRAGTTGYAVLRELSIRRAHTPLCSPVLEIDGEYTHHLTTYPATKPAENAFLLFELKSRLNDSILSGQVLDLLLFRASGQ